MSTNPMRLAGPEKDPMSVDTTVLHVFKTCIVAAFVSGFCADWGYRTAKRDKPALSFHVPMNDLGSLNVSMNRRSVTI